MSVVVRWDGGGVYVCSGCTGKQGTVRVAVCRYGCDVCNQKYGQATFSTRRDWGRIEVWMQKVVEGPTMTPRPYLIHTTAADVRRCKPFGS